MAFHWDRANRLLEQTQRRVYGIAARVLRRGGGGGGGVKIFRWGVSPSKKAQGTAIHTRLFVYVGLFESTAFTSTSGVPPSSRTADNTILRIVPTQMANERTVYALGDL